MATLISDNTHTAKKKHLCDLCHLPIEVGEKYKRQFWEDGHAYAFKMHLVCEDISRHYSQEHDSFDNEGYDHNYFSNDVCENFASVTGYIRDGFKYKEMVQIFKEHWIKARKEANNG